MTEEGRSDEPLEEAIEDLEAPAAAQDDVAGGRVVCQAPTCKLPDTAIFCRGSSCSATERECQLQTAAIVVKAV